MKRYEGLFILNTAGKEEGVNELVDKLKAEIAAQGVTIETVQKMEKRAFARVSDDQKIKEGFYVNFIFEGGPDSVKKLQHHFALSEHVFRMLFTEAPRKAEAK